ncbi:hypothetical protein JCM17961_17630 [Endothiovibrio diazotrophicus]
MHMFKKKLLGSAIAGVLVSGSFAASNAMAVEVSNTARGGVLLGSMYVARADDFNTSRVKVVNPSTTDAVKAKLVFRSKMHSDECKDMILYLTPGDVAYVDVRLDANGSPEVCPMMTPCWPPSPPTAAPSSPRRSTVAGAPRWLRPVPSPPATPAPWATSKWLVPTPPVA